MPDTDGPLITATTSKELANRRQNLTDQDQDQDKDKEPLKQHPINNDVSEGTITAETNLKDPIKLKSLLEHYQSLVDSHHKGMTSADRINIEALTQTAINNIILLLLIILDFVHMQNVPQPRPHQGILPTNDTTGPQVTGDATGPQVTGDATGPQVTGDTGPIIRAAPAGNSGHSGPIIAAVTGKSAPTQDVTITAKPIKPIKPTPS